MKALGGQEIPPLFIMARKLSTAFIQDLKTGRLRHILDLVKNDLSLVICLRNSEINIYFKGANLLKISEQQKGYKTHFNQGYLTDEWKAYWGELKTLPSVITSEEDALVWILEIPKIKMAIDFYLSKKQNTEREIQQLMMRESNFEKNSYKSDYFIVDIEYKEKKGRFDAIAIKWDSNVSARKLQKGYLPSLCFIEIKYGDAALEGKSGFISHLNDMNDFLGDSSNYKALQEEMIVLFSQKRELGLIPALDSNPNQITELSQETPDFIFLLANHNPNSSSLQTIIDSIETPCYYNLKFVVSNFAGYSLFRESIFDLEEFKAKFSKQIYSKNETNHSIGSE